MYKKIYLGLLLIWSVYHYGQIVLNSPPAPNTEKSDPYSIRLVPGFNFNSSNGTFRAYIGTSTSGNNPYNPVNIDYSTNITANENYIYTREYLVPTTTSDGSLKQIQRIQFFDGLGRPKQTVSIKSTSSGKDLVTHIPYDNFGRQVDNWLPVPMASQNGNIHANVESSTNTYYQSNGINDTYPYLHKNVENSPLDRILSQKNPGGDWQNKPVTYTYDANVDGEVKKYATTTIWENGATKSDINLSGNYSVGQLYKNSVKDEDGHETIEFKNAQGQTILIRKVLSPTENADTYYVYNEYNQLAFVIPPKASVEVLSTTLLDHLCYEYRYDGKNRLVEKKLPGKGWEQMVYNKKDQIILSRDTNLKNGIPNFIENEAWVFTKYDKFGRVVYTGISRDGTSRQNIQNYVDDQPVVGSYETRGGSLTLNGMTIEYSNSSYPTNLSKLLSVNYYDTYPQGAPSFPTQILGQNVLTQDPQNMISTKSMATASYVKNIEDDNWTKSYTYYDSKGRIIGGHTINHLGGYTKTESFLKFSGKPDYTYTYHKRSANDSEVSIKENFEYDHQERLVRHWSQVNGGTQELLAENLYNDLGQIQTKNVGNTTGNPLQSINYNYNIRGWLSKINDPASLGNRLFAYELRYNNPNNQFSGTAKYNGNISQVSWITQNDSVLRNYSYDYDPLNRLKEGRFWDAMNLEREEYFEQLTYDLNGNIKTLLRRGRQFPGYTAPEVMDDLEYQYENNGLSNKLSYLKEIGTGNAINGYPLSSGNTGGTIPYDLNGNMTSQADKGISSIVYNYLNLPNQILSVQGNTSYTYRADGVKIKKVIGAKTTDYVDGFQYENNLLKFIPTTEGYYNFENNKYIYNYVDHLGNVRLSYTNNGSGAEILEENNYYPFGLKHEGYNQLTGNPTYQYKYNGKELQENGMYDYGARFYMPDIGRWGVVDPLAEVNRAWSPYRYAYNNPLRFIDPDGRLEGDPPGFLSRAWKEVKSWFSSSKGSLSVGEVQEVPMNYGEGQTRLFGLIQNANVDSNGNSPLENYRTWRDNPNYNPGESKMDRIFRGMNSAHMEIMRDEGSGGGLMYGGFGRAAKAVNAAEETSNLIGVKNTAPQVGEAFQNLGATIADGNISLSGRAVTNGRFDFVVTASGELKVGTGHFNLSGGANEVQAAGQLRLFKGQVMEINNASGHYQPSAAEAKQFPTILSNMGVDVSKAKLKTFSVE